MTYGPRKGKEPKTIAASSRAVVRAWEREVTEGPQIDTLTDEEKTNIVRTATRGASVPIEGIPPPWRLLIVEIFLDYVTTGGRTPVRDLEDRAGVPRRTYARMRESKLGPSLLSWVRGLVVQHALESVGPVFHALINKATKGSAKHQELYLRAVGMLRDEDTTKRAGVSFTWQRELVYNPQTGSQGERVTVTAGDATRAASDPVDKTGA